MMHMTISKLYYECHITIEPVFDEQLEEVKELASRAGFRVANLLMQKRKEDKAERSMYDTFMTSTNVNYENLQGRMLQAIDLLKKAGYKVWRYKIEDTLLDSKHCDELGLIT